MSTHHTQITPKLRIHQIHQRLKMMKKTETRKAQERAIHKAQVEAVADVYLVVQRRPLSEKPFVWRQLARLVYWAIGWSSDYGVEYQSVCTTESEARYLSSADGWSYTKVPVNGCLPAETCQYGTHDFPLSEASHWYRQRKLPRISFPQHDVMRLEEKLRQADLQVERARLA